MNETKEYYVRAENKTTGEVMENYSWIASSVAAAKTSFLRRMFFIGFLRNGCEYTVFATEK